VQRNGGIQSLWDAEKLTIRPKGMLATLAPVAVVSAIYIAAFLVLRKSQRRYYAPRTYLGNLKER
jgi:hypothetical protein